MAIISPVVAHVLACAVMVSVQKSRASSVPSKSHGPSVRSSGPSSSSYAHPDSYVARSRPAWYFNPLFAVFLD